MIEFWHNPRCSKSRAALALLQDRGADLCVRRYLEDTPTLADLIGLRAALGQPPVISMMRAGEKTFRDLGLDRTNDDATLLAAMVEHPILIERPMAIADGRAVIGRPPENVLAIL